MKAIILQGNSFEIGRQHGTYLKNTIQAFLRNDFAGINKLNNRSITEEKLTHIVDPYKQVISEQLPDLYLEIQGVAAGAGISVDEAVLLQIRREIIGVNAYALTGDCSSVGILNGESSILAQTIDLNGGMTDLGYVFNIHQEGKPQIIQYSFAGLLGYMGMNDAGLAISINLVVCTGWQTGISPYLLVRKLLQYDSIEKCLEILETLTVASSRSFLIMDKKRLINVEITPTGFRVIEGEYLSHTNHFLHEDYKAIDTLNIFSKNSSVKRKNLLDEYVSIKPGQATIQMAFKDHTLYPTGICAHNMDNPQLSETVAAVIMYPHSHRQEFWAVKGKPCQSNYTLYTL
jgi:isopenicillin-N N-acyltransferase-like protein